MTISRTSLILLVFAVLGWALYGCKQDQPPLPPPPQVTVSKPLVREIKEWDDYTGRLEAVDTVDVRARVSGYLESIHFKDGEMVKQGDLLFVIDPRPYQAELDRAEAELKLAQARLSLAINDLSRAQHLVSARAISEEEADTKASDEQVARATVEQAEAQVKAAKLNVEFTQVRAPISGLISRKYVTVGNLINGGTGGTLLTTIVSLDPIYCYFEADEQSYLKYTNLQQEGKLPDPRHAKNPAYMEVGNETGYPHKGYVDFLDNRLDPNTGTIRGRGVFGNPDNTLTPGLFARMKITGSGEYKAILVPDEAIGSDQAQKYVMVVNPENAVEYRQVTLGPLVNGLRVIREGVKPEDRIIVKGMQRAMPGVKVSPVEEDIAVNEKNFLTPGIDTQEPGSTTGG
ncbi:MAG TPA: efflux RND transporter periplasmic adaptor subunit [Thermodesulfobacteriota bacterium]|nr:efflux RND transporter periplasmic adaptor subunit [Thermodesulfobacteriota bacterium]